jgi:glycosyltransferase involved in cell wall biosynthesis
MVPLVSILLPFRNAGRFLPHSVRSIIDNTMEDWELLLINDHSTDDSMGIAREFERKDPRIQVYESSERGIVTALNSGLHQAGADIIARMDADDVCLPRRLEIQYREMRSRPDIDVTSCLVEPPAGRPVTEGSLRYLAWLNSSRTDGEIKKDLFIESPLPHPSVMFRKKQVLEINGYREYPGPEDYDLWLRLKEKGRTFSKVPEILLQWRIHSESLSRKHSHYSLKAFENRKFLHLQWALKSNFHAGRDLWIWGAGRFGGRLGKWLMNNGFPVAGFIDIDPEKEGSTRHDVPVHLPDEIMRGPDNRFYLGYVSRWNARDDIRKCLTEKGKREGKEFLIL